jgi:AcrR family transcriptional regulator
MQLPKDAVKNDILSAAREEFLQKGYEKASIRSIAGAAGTSKSNIYNYFSDKDALFCAVVEPTLSAMESGFGKIRAQNDGNVGSPIPLKRKKRTIVQFMLFVYTHESDLKLLLFYSSGSSLAESKEHAIRLLTGLLEDWLQNAAPESDIPQFFIQTIARFYIGAIEQMLLLGFTKEQAEIQFEAFLQFVYGGWSAVLSSAHSCNRDRQTEGERK